MYCAQRYTPRPRYRSLKRVSLKFDAIHEVPRIIVRAGEEWSRVGTLVVALGPLKRTVEESLRLWSGVGWGPLWSPSGFTDVTVNSGMRKLGGTTKSIIAFSSQRGMERFFY
jgi:hypothetical protein